MLVSGVTLQFHATFIVDRAGAPAGETGWPARANCHLGRVRPACLPETPLDQPAWMDIMSVVRRQPGQPHKTLLLRRLPGWHTVADSVLLNVTVCVNWSKI